MQRPAHPIHRPPRELVQGSFIALQAGALREDVEAIDVGSEELEVVRPQGLEGQLGDREELGTARRREEDVAHLQLGAPKLGVGQHAERIVRGDREEVGQAKLSQERLGQQLEEQGGVPLARTVEGEVDGVRAHREHVLVHLPVLGGRGRPSDAPQRAPREAHQREVSAFQDGHREGKARPAGGQEGDPIIALQQRNDAFLDDFRGEVGELH